jgi:hypothetical protein
MTRDTRIAIFVLAVCGLAGLLNFTWMLGQISRAIVGQDEVWGLMDQRGLHAEHSAMEMFNVARLFILPLEAILGVVFLGMLWSALFRPTKSANQLTPPSSPQSPEADAP